MNAWLLVGLLQPFFVALMFAQRGRREAASFWLFVWLGVVVLHQFAIYLGFAHPSLTPLWLAVGFGLMPFLHGPLAYSYVASILPDPPRSRTLLLHFIPFAMLWAALLAVMSARPGGFTVDTSYAITIIRQPGGGTLGWLGWAMALSGAIYPLAAFSMLRSRRAALLDRRSDINAVKFRWLEIWIYGHLTAFAAIFIAQTATTVDVAMPIVSWIMAAEVFYLAFFGVWHFERSGPPAAPQHPAHRSGNNRTGCATPVAIHAI